MSSETGEIASLRHEEMTTKHEADGISHTIPGINRIKTEPSGVDSDKETVKTMGEEQSLTSAGNVEQVFIKKEDPEETVSNSIKSEIDWDKCIAEDQSILDMEAENYKLDMEMRSQIKEELKIKEEWDEDPDEVCEVSASRIKKEYSEADSLGKGAVGGVIKEEDMEEEEYKLITEDCDIKSESDTSMDATSEVPSNSTSNLITFRKPRQVLYEKVGKELFKCNNCDYTAYNKCQIFVHLREHSNKKYVSREKHNFSISDEKFENKKILSTSNRGITNFDRDLSTNPETASRNKLTMCIQCSATFKSKIAIDDHVVRKHPEFMKSVTYKIYECTDCIYKTTIKANFVRHVTGHSESGSRVKYTCIHCKATLEERSALDEHIMKKHPDFCYSNC